MDTCSAPAPVLMPYFSSFYVKVNSVPEVVVLLSGVSGITLNGEVCTVVSAFLVCTWNLDNML